MKKDLLITFIMMLVALTSGMKAVAASKQAYYVINGGTLYFYYDENYDSRQGTSKDYYGYYLSPNYQPYWESYKESIVRVVFDSSFAEAVRFSIGDESRFARMYARNTETERTMNEM